jgi:hypothetical protein
MSEVEDEDGLDVGASAAILREQFAPGHFFSEN